jgi:DNA-binding NarL/FixJ family response regulator
VKRVTVLLADDHAIVVEGLRRVLEAEFDVIGVVGDGRSLVAAAKKLKPDVIVVDISMPLLNGIDATRQIRTTNHRVKFVFLSVHPDVLYVSEAIQAGGSAYVSKTSAGTEIMAAIKAALQGRTYLSPSIDSRAVETQIKRDERSHQAPRSLTRRQREVVQLVAEGRSNKEIADILRISPRTVEFHRQQVMELLGLHSIADMVQYAVKHRITSV